MLSNQSGRRTRGKRQGDEPPEIRVVSATPFDAEERLHRAYKLILLVAEQAKLDRRIKTTKSQGVVDNG